MTTMKWRPIEEAPRKVQVLCCDARGYRALCTYEDGRWEPNWLEPIWWMPLPEPPEQ